MSGGVPMFIYTKDNVAWFDENSDTIEEYLSDWYHDNMGENNYIGAIASNGTFSVGSIQNSNPYGMDIRWAQSSWDPLPVDPDYW